LEQVGRKYRKSLEKKKYITRYMEKKKTNTRYMEKKKTFGKGKDANKG